MKKISGGTKSFIVVAIVAVAIVGTVDMVRAQNRTAATRAAFNDAQGVKNKQTTITTLQEKLRENQPLQVSFLKFKASINNSSANLDNYACIRLIQQIAEALTNGDGDGASASYHAAEEAGCGDLNERRFCGDMEVGMDSLAESRDWDGFSQMAEFWSGAGCSNEAN